MKNALLLAVLLLLPAVQAQAPQGIHVAISGTDADWEFGPPEAPSLMVHWTVQTAYPEGSTPVVVWSDATGQQRTIEAELLDPQPFDLEATMDAIVDPVNQLTGGDPRQYFAGLIQAPRGTVVTYSVGIAGAMSPEYTITNLATRPGTPIEVIVVGGTTYAGCDLATGTCGQTFPQTPTAGAVQFILEAGPEFVLHAGGVASSSSDPTNWDATFSILESAATVVPFAFTPNDDDETARYAQYDRRIRTPGTTMDTAPAITESGTLQDVHEQSDMNTVLMSERNKRFYGFSAGPAYFVNLDAASICSAGQKFSYGVVPANEAAQDVINDHGPCENDQVYNAEQFEWLHDTLEDAREDLGARWIVVNMGIGPYHFADDAQTDQRIVDGFVHLFESFNVDLVIGSQEPFYQRSYPLWGGLPTTYEDGDFKVGSGPIYMITGAAGRTPPDGRFLAAAPPWLAADAYDFHAVHLDIQNETLTARAVTIDGNQTVLDEFVLHHPDSAGYDDAHGPGLPQDGPSQDSPLPITPLMLALTFLVVRRR